MRVAVNKAEYRALNGLRGLPAGAHTLVMCALPTPTGGVLDGSETDFAELVSFIGGEIADGTLPASRALLSLCLKIDPECGDWLGL